MTSMHRFFERLQAIRPVSRTYTPEQMAEIHRREHQEQLNAIHEHCIKAQIQASVGRSGIAKKHLKCSFENYHTDCAAQRQAWNAANAWLANHQRGLEGGFVFAGTPGTGKNHLASAIANTLIADGGSVLVITVSELMMRIRDTYNKHTAITEAAMLKHLASIDLLVLDEIGIQRDTNNERIVLNEIINARSAAEKPTGILTNLTSDELVKALGERALERVMEGPAACWVTFNWVSYRKAKAQKAGRAA